MADKASQTPQGRARWVEKSFETYGLDKSRATEEASLSPAWII